MTNNNQLSNEELAQIRKRSEMAAAGNPLKDINVLARMDRVILEDIPKLLAEIEMLRDEVELYEEIVDSKDEQLEDIREILTEEIE